MTLQAACKGNGYASRIRFRRVEYCGTRSRDEERHGREDVEKSGKCATDEKHGSDHDSAIEKMT